MSLCPALPVLDFIGKIPRKEKQTSGPEMVMKTTSDFLPSFNMKTKYTYIILCENRLL